MIEITILGSGTSTGVPTIGCNCDVCCSTDPHDKRLRCSSMLKINGYKYLVDCGPDFRQQALRSELTSIDALILTHNHFDHVAGIDDLRFFKKFDLYALPHVIKAIHKSYSYIFSETNYVGAKPTIEEHVVSPSEQFILPGNVEVTPVVADHISMRVLGFRIGDFAYLTDFKTIEPEELDKLKGVRCLILGVLRITEQHRSHLSLEEALRLLEKINPENAFFVHMSHGIGFHKEAERYLTEKLGHKKYHFAYDGMRIAIHDDGHVSVLPDCF